MPAKKTSKKEFVTIISSHEDYVALCDFLLFQGYKFQHESIASGYTSKKVYAELYRYRGNFGEGYIIQKHRNTPSSIIEYWLG